MSERIAGLLRSVPAVVAVGAAHFSESLREQAITVVQVDWRPPPADDRVRRALDRLM